MDLQDLKRLNSLLSDFTWFGRTFLQTGTGREWDAIDGRGYFTTAWMEFYTGIKDGTYYDLAKSICDASFMPHFGQEVEKQLRPLLEQLEAMETQHENLKIKVHIDTDKFGRYEDQLKKMSRDKIIFDIIADSEDIRDTYFVEDNPEQTRSYLIQVIREVLHRYGSAEQEKIRGLENRVKELEAGLQEKNTLLALQDSQHGQLARTVKEQQEQLTTLTERNRELETALSEYRQQDEEADNAVIDPSSPIEDAKLRMYFFYKLGFLDKSIWNDRITYKRMATVLRKILGGKPITQDSAQRYAKLFNATGHTQLKQYEADNEHKVLDYLKSVCPDMDFPKGKFVNDIMRRTNRNEQ